MSVDEKILARIQKTLALANNNPNQEEAEAALLKAQALMAKHNLEMSDVNIDVKKDKEIKDDAATDWMEYNWWVGSLAQVIAKNFRCTVYLSTLRAGRRGKKDQAKVMFVGLKEDVEIAKVVYGFALSSMESNGDAYMKKLRKQGFSTRNVKNDYFLGWINGIEDKFKEQVERENWGLVLVQDEAVIEYVKNELNLTRSASNNFKTAGMSEARNAGYEAGKSFQSAKGHIE